MERTILVDPLAQSFRRSGVEHTWRHDVSSRGLAPAKSQVMFLNELRQFRERGCDELAGERSLLE